VAGHAQVGDRRLLLPGNAKPDGTEGSAGLGLPVAAGAIQWVYALVTSEAPEDGCGLCCGFQAGAFDLSRGDISGA
jgi:hypothetical protein